MKLDTSTLPMSPVAPRRCRRGGASAPPRHTPSSTPGNYTTNEDASPAGDLLLVVAGDIRPGRQGLGIDVNANSEVLDVSGRSNLALLAMGPLTRGTFWEIISVPDIRLQAWSVARRLSNAHWVEGEGL